MRAYFFHATEPWAIEDDQDAAEAVLRLWLALDTEVGHEGEMWLAHLGNASLLNVVCYDQDPPRSQRLAWIQDHTMAALLVEDAGTPEDEDWADPDEASSPHALSEFCEGDVSWRGPVAWNLDDL